MNKCVLLLLVIGLNFASAQSIKLAIDDWAPFFGKKLREGGVTAHLTKKVLEDAGYTVEVNWIPWQRALKLTEKAQIDVTSGWGDSDDRAEKFFLSELPVLVGQEVYIYEKGVGLKSNSFDEVKSLPFTAVKGYDYPDNLMNGWRDGSIKAHMVNTDEEMFQAILDGKAKILSTDKSVGLSIINDSFSANKMKFGVSEPYAEAKYFILVGKAHPKSKEMMGKINASLKKLTDDGTVKKFYQDNINGMYK